MDETPLSFDLPNPTTVTQHGSKSVTIRTTGHERTCFTVILACMADGSKLPPMCIFKLKTSHAIYFQMMFTYELTKKAGVMRTK